MTSLDLATAVRHIDRALRGHLGIHEFTPDAQCVFRLALSQARDDLRLSDGTEIRAGDPLLELHFWNEHLPAMPRGPDAAWANRFRHMIHTSLDAIADHIGAERQYDAIKAVHGSPPFASRIGRPQMERAARRFGFEVVAPESTSELRQLCQQFFDVMVLWGLAYAFNPTALHNTSQRQRYQVWMSRRRLLTLYGANARPTLQDIYARRHAAGAIDVPARGSAHVDLAWPQHG